MEILTNTEEQIIQATMQGLSNKEIASSNFRSVHTIITHWKNIKRKLNAKNMAQAVSKYLLIVDNPKQLLKMLLFFAIQMHLVFNVTDIDMRMARRVRTSRTRTTNVRKK